MALPFAVQGRYEWLHDGLRDMLAPWQRVHWERRPLGPDVRFMCGRVGYFGLYTRLPRHVSCKQCKWQMGAAFRGKLISK